MTLDPSHPMTFGPKRRSPQHQGRHPLPSGVRWRRRARCARRIIDPIGERRMARGQSCCTTASGRSSTPATNRDTTRLRRERDLPRDWSRPRCPALIPCRADSSSGRPEPRSTSSTRGWSRCSGSGAVGELSLEVAPGAYQVSARIAGTENTQLVVVRPGDSTEIDVPVRFDAAAPVEGTTTANEAHGDLARDLTGTDDRVGRLPTRHRGPLRWCSSCAGSWTG